MTGVLAASRDASGVLGRPVGARGRTTVSGTALRSVAAAAAATALGVARREVHVDLSDDGGRLAVVVRTPVVVELTAGARADAGWADPYGDGVGPFDDVEDAEDAEDADDTDDPDSQGDRDAGRAGGSEGTVVALAETARQRAARALAELAGAGVGSCRLVVTSVRVTTRGRTGRKEALL